MINSQIIKTKFENIVGFQSIQTIYTLSHPITKSVFYVGVTQRELSDRLLYHIRSAKSEPGSFRKNNFIRELLNIGLTPIIEPIETVVTKSYIQYLETFKIEAFWINQLKQWGFELLNTHHSKNRCRNYLNGTYGVDPIKDAYTAPKTT